MLRKSGAAIHLAPVSQPHSTRAYLLCGVDRRRLNGDASFVCRSVSSALHPSGIVSTPRAHALAHAARPHLRHLQDDLLREVRFDPSTSMRPIADLDYLISLRAAMTSLAEQYVGLPADVSFESAGLGVEVGKSS